MSTPQSTICCPVCRMTKINRTLSFSFQGVDHYFCSSQCLERFKAHPHLFVGDPQHGLSPKQNKQVVLKQRRIVLKKTISEDLKAVLEKSLRSLMGIKQIGFDQQVLFVSYDLLQVSLDTIEKVIEDNASQQNGTMLGKIKRSIIHYSEECELGNLAHLTKGGGYH